MLRNLGVLVKALVLGQGACPAAHGSWPRGVGSEETDGARLPRGCPLHVPGQVSENNHIEVRPRTSGKLVKGSLL